MPPVKTKSHLSVKVPCKWAHRLWSPNEAPVERDGPFPEALVYSFIHIWVPSYGAVPRNGENMVAIHRSPVQNGVRPDSPMGSCTTLLLLPQCHAVFSVILSTLACVDQSLLSQCFLVTLYRCPLHICYQLPHDLWCGSPHYCEGQMSVWSYESWG
jgi:hypothetical protein